MKCEAWQYTSRPAVARIFHIGIRIGGLVLVIARDTYLRGRGRMMRVRPEETITIRPLSLIRCFVWSYYLVIAPPCSSISKSQQYRMTIHKLSDPLAHSYLDGTRFDETITFGYDFLTPLQNRVELLSELAAGKRILHIGCCDHIPLMRRKMADRTWLHGRLTEAAAYCIGIDIDAEAISEARSLSRLSNIFYGDITVKPKIAEIGDDKFDYTLLGEVMEHIGNPVHFLKSFLSNYKENIGQVIITVPNALRSDNILNVLKARETINSDHRFFFTPYTIAKVAWDAGLAPVSIQMALYSPAGPLKRAILNRFPLLAGDLVYIGASRS